MCQEKILMKKSECTLHNMQCTHNIQNREKKINKQKRGDMNSKALHCIELFSYKEC